MCGSSINAEPCQFVSDILYAIGRFTFFPNCFGGHRLAPVLGALGHGDAPLVLDLRRRGPELAAGVRPRRGTEGMQAL